MNPTWQDEVICDIRTEASQTEAPHTGQTVVNTSQDFTNQKEIHLSRNPGRDLRLDFDIK